jgi:hypothetical protein
MLATKSTFKELSSVDSVIVVVSSCPDCHAVCSIFPPKGKVPYFFEFFCKQCWCWFRGRSYSTETMARKAEVKIEC